MAVVLEPNLQLIQEEINSNTDEQNLELLLDSVMCKHINVVKLLIAKPGFCVSANYNQAYVASAARGYLDILKLLLTQPGVNNIQSNNLALNLAVVNCHLHIVEFLLDTYDTNVAGGNNQAIHNVAYYYGDIVMVDTIDKRYNMLSILAIFLYFEPEVKNTLNPDYYLEYHRKLLINIRPIVHKIAVSMIELPTPIIIEIVEAYAYFAIYIPYHIKWNMVIAIKHSKK